MPRKVKISTLVRDRITNDPTITDDMKNAMFDNLRFLADEGANIDNEFRQLAVQDNVQKLMAKGNIVDAVPSALMARALEYAVTQAIYLITSYTVWRSIIPIDSDMPRGADSKIYTIWEAAGMAEWYRGGGKHPNVSIGQRRISIPFDSITTSFTVDWLEMLGSSYAGVSVEAEKAKACFEYLDRKVESIVFEGDAAHDRPPLIDHTNITAGNMTTGTWSSATAAQILADCKYGITQVVTQCTDDEDFQPMMVDIMLSPTHQRMVTSYVANAYTNQTIEGVLRASDGKFGRFINSPKHGSVDSGTNITFGALSDKNSICVSLSMDRERMPQDNRGHFVEQPFITKIGRLHVKHPLRFWQGNNA